VDKKNKTRITDPTRIFTLANFVSLLRAFMAIPIIYTMLIPELWLVTLILILIAIASDALDGYFARRAHEVTHLGKWLDPVADFIVIATVTYYLVLFDKFSQWFFILFIARYLFIGLQAIYLMNHSQYVMSSNILGKWSAGITAITISLHIFVIPGLDWLRVGSLWLAVVMLIISWILYIKTFIVEVRKI
jgi:CDP-diacylglycerol--glycerol-3-phosphate 3-phosphatidyltransferase